MLTCLPLSLTPPSPPVLLQWHMHTHTYTHTHTHIHTHTKRSLCQKRRWQVTPKHAYALVPTRSEWADFIVQAQWGKELTYNLSVGARPHSSRLAEALLTDPGFNWLIKCLSLSPPPPPAKPPPPPILGCGEKSHHSMSSPPLPSSLDCTE